MKIFIGYPPTVTRFKGTPLLSQNRQYQVFHVHTTLFPVVLATGATMLRDQGHDVTWVDCIAEKLSTEDFYKLVEEKKPDIFFFETKAPVVKIHWEIINEIKEKFPNLKICVMGDHVSAVDLTLGLQKEFMEKCKVDYIINGGYFDFAFCELVEALEKKKKIPEGIWYKDNKGKIIENGRYNFKGNLDDAPIIDRVFTKNHLYQHEFNLIGRPLAYIMAGRDCWYGKCTFCVWDTNLYPKGSFRGRSPENVMKEVKYLVDECGVKEIFDDAGTIIVGPWLKKFCNLMIESGYNKKVIYSGNMRFGAVSAEDYKLMKQAGFRLLKYGLESGCQSTINKLDKGTKIEEVEKSCREAKEAKLQVHLTMMCGYSFETREDALKTYKLAKRLMLKGYADVLQSTVIVPYPGTPLYKEGMEKNWFRFDPRDYERFDMREPVFKTPDMTPDQVTKLNNKIYYIFLDPRYVLRHLRKIKSFEDIVYTLRGIKAVVGHILDFSTTAPQSEESPIR